MLPWPTPSSDPCRVPASRPRRAPRPRHRARAGLALGRQGFGINDVGRFRDQVAGHADAVGQFCQRREGLARRFGVGGADGQSGQGRFPVRLFLGPVFVEAVAAQPGAEAGPRRRCRPVDLAAVDRIEQHCCRARAGAVKGRHGAAAGILRRQCIELLRLAEAIRITRSKRPSPGLGRTRESPPPPLKRLAATARVTAPSSALSAASADAVSALSLKAKMTSEPSFGRARSSKTDFHAGEPVAKGI